METPPKHTPHTQAAQAHQALGRMLAAPQCGLLVEAVISKYVALTTEELEEWQTDPESYARCA